MCCFYAFFRGKKVSQPVSRVLSGIIIHLDWKSPSSLKRPTRKRCGPHQCFPIWSCSEWGLPCHFCYQKRGALLPHPFTLTSRSWRSTLCCTGRRLTPPRRYLAPCPVEPGLSSSLTHADQRLSGWLGIEWYLKRCPESIDLSMLL